MIRKIVYALFTPLEKAADFNQVRNISYKAAGSLKSSSAYIARSIRKIFSNGVIERSSLTGFTPIRDNKKRRGPGLFAVKDSGNFCSDKKHGTRLPEGNLSLTGFTVHFFMDFFKRGRQNEGC